MSRVSRRRLLRGLGIGTAAAWLAPVATSWNGIPDRRCDSCREPCDWSCDREPCHCGGGCGPIGAAYCSPDIDGNCFCWEDWPCLELADCAQNSDCPPGYACIPNTCCGPAASYSASGVLRLGPMTRPNPPKCLPACGLGSKTSRRRGRMTSGRVL